MRCHEIEVVIVKSFRDGQEVDYIPLDERINDTLREHREKEFIDVRLIDDQKAMVIMQRKW